MFERRLKIFLGILLAISATLVLRAAQVQVLQREHWRAQAAETLKRSRLIETFRGNILDRLGRPVAIDQPCIDACVDYRALESEPDPRWLSERASERLRLRLGERLRTLDSAELSKLRKEEIEKVRADIRAMWAKLAEESGQSLEEVEQIRRAIVQRVEMRRRHVWYRNYQLAVNKFENRPPPPAWQKWLIDEAQDMPEIDDFSITVAEQTEPHVVLRAISAETQVRLGKHIERFPGLVLRPSTHRYYPYGEAACHVLGRLSRVAREDLASDPNVGKDELRQYYPNDLIGRSGIESLCEAALRGTRGRVQIDVDGGKELERTSTASGGNVRISIDIELQQQIQSMLEAVKLKTSDGKIETAPMHGAVVVLDVPTNEVLVLASNPGFDLNKYDDLYPLMSKDELNNPLLNRATQAQLEPGSTIKPVIGLSGVTQGVIKADQGVECTGYLVINGKTLPRLRCWVTSKFHATLCGPDCTKLPCPTVAHHPVPWSAQHPTGFLTLSDAIERSCNPYFSAIADRLRMEGLSYWFDRFGLGRITGIGIAESKGLLPSSYRGSERAFQTWSAGIGQGPVAVTPLQMANVAASIARNGIWMRPRLTSANYSEAAGISDRVDLKLAPEAIAAVREGMTRVVNSKAGTGTALHRDDVTIAGKTGTAQASRLRVKLKTRSGQPVLDDKGRPKMEFLQISTQDHPNPQAPWYRGTGADGDDLNHAWFIGFAPAENPKIAFAVLVEYGGSGGQAAGGVAQDVLEACIEHGYLPLRHR